VGTWRLADVAAADVRELYAELREDGASTSALKRLRAALSALFATAVEDRLLTTNPVQGVRIPPAPTGEPEDERAKALTRAELATVLAALPADWRLFFELLTHTGLRISEAIGLTWQHVDLGTVPRVRVREQFCEGERRQLKSKHARRDVPLSPGMAERLRERRRDTYRGDRAPVFATTTGTELSRPNVAGRVLKPAAEAVGLPWASFHSFRHSCASLLFAEGRNVKQVQEWLGHADPSFTLRTYVHLLDEGIGDADFLDTVLTPPSAHRSNRDAPGLTAPA
jgi:integrase